jgi:hypothetical protein
MTLTQDQEIVEHELRVEQMTVNIEKLRSDIRYESRKVQLQTLAAVSTAFAAGVAALGLVLHLMGKL